MGRQELCTEVGVHTHTVTLLTCDTIHRLDDLVVPPLVGKSGRSAQIQLWIGRLNYSLQICDGKLTMTMYQGASSN